MSIMKVTEQNFSQVVLASDKPVILDFYADWCGPCRMLAPTLEEIAAERNDIVIGKINVDEEGALAQRFGVVSIPTLVIIKNGEEVNRVVGVRSKDEILDLV